MSLIQDPSVRMLQQRSPTVFSSAKAAADPTAKATKINACKVRPTEHLPFLYIVISKRTLHSKAGGALGEAGGYRCSRRRFHRTDPCLASIGCPAGLCD